MAYAYVGIAVPPRQPAHPWSKHALDAIPASTAGYDSAELGGWFVRTDLVDERIRTTDLTRRLQADPAGLRRDPLLRLYAVISTDLTITHRARLQHDHWNVQISNRAWIDHLRELARDAAELTFAIVHVTPEGSPHAATHQPSR